MHDYTSSRRSGPVGLGGWLILPFIGMMLSVAVCAWSGLTTLPFLGDDYRLTEAMVFAVRFQLAHYAIVGCLAPVGLLILFFNRKRQFPPLYILWQVILLVLAVLEFSILQNAFSNRSTAFGGVAQWEADASQGLWQAAISAIIWTCYMLTSRRVKNTFVE